MVSPMKAMLLMGMGVKSLLLPNGHVAGDIGWQCWHSHETIEGTFLVYMLQTAPEVQTKPIRTVSDQEGQFQLKPEIGFGLDRVEFSTSIESGAVVINDAGNGFGGGIDIHQQAQPACRDGAQEETIVCLTNLAGLRCKMEQTKLAAASLKDAKTECTGYDNEAKIVNPVCHSTPSVTDLPAYYNGRFAIQTKQYYKLPQFEAPGSDVTGSKNNIWMIPIQGIPYASTDSVTQITRSHADMYTGFSSAISLLKEEQVACNIYSGAIGSWATYLMPLPLSYMMQAHVWSLLDNRAPHCPDGFIHLNLGTVQLKRKTLSCSPGGGKCRADLNQLPDDYTQILELKTHDFIQTLATLPIGTFPTQPPQVFV